MGIGQALGIDIEVGGRTAVVKWKGSAFPLSRRARIEDIEIHTVLEREATADKHLPGVATDLRAAKVARRDRGVRGPLGDGRAGGVRETLGIRGDSDGRRVPDVHPPATCAMALRDVDGGTRVVWDCPAAGKRE